MTPRVLFADGDANTRNSCDLLLTTCGYEVETASDGLQCATRLSDWRPDVLVLGRQLPFGGADGVLELIRTDYTMPSVPVVLLDEGHAPLELADCMSSPVVACVPKPLSIRVLLWQLALALRLRPPHDRLQDSVSRPDVTPGDDGRKEIAGDNQASAEEAAVRIEALWRRMRRP